MRGIAIGCCAALLFVATALPGALGQDAPAAGARRPKATSSGRPHIIVVLSDDVGLSRIGCYGGAPFETPNIDRLAATGLRFERCYSMPICGPSRAALLTGKYPFRTGAVGNGSSVIDPSRHTTLPQVLRQAGYATCAIGKLGQSAEADDGDAPFRLGFDEYMLWMGRSTPDRYWYPRYWRNGQIWQGEPEQYGPDVTHEFLVDFLRRRGDQPCFVYYSAVLTHGPFVRTPESAASTSDDDQAQLVVDMVSYLDRQMGRLIDDLDRLGIRDETIVLFTSDNGPAGQPLGTVDGARLVGAKGDVGEGGVREPLIVNCPGRVPAGQVCQDLTDFTDFFPTVLELAGVESPADLELDGRSIAPQILGRPGVPRPWVYAQHGNQWFIADRQYKLYGDGRMVDIEGSPTREVAIASGDRSAARGRARLAAALADLRAGYPDVPARSAATSRGRDALTSLKASPRLETVLALLVDRGIIDSPQPWQNRSEVDGEQVRELMRRAVRQLEPDGDAADAIAVLQRHGVLGASDYWRERATSGGVCPAGTVARLIDKLAAALQAQ